MADTSDFFEELEEQLQPPDIEEIKFILKGTLSSKLLIYIILKF